MILITIHKNHHLKKKKSTNWIENEIIYNDEWIKKKCICRYFYYITKIQ